MQLLKEWASAILAMQDGVQTVILRKGGIQETASGFSTEAKRFLLFPTYEHQRKEDLKTEHAKYAQMASESAPQDGAVSVCLMAEVVAEADVDPDAAARLSPMHIWSDEFVAQRQKWMPQKPMRALLLRASTISPETVRLGPEHAGCKSWVASGIEPQNASSVLSDDQMAERQSAFEVAAR